MVNRITGKHSLRFTEKGKAFMDIGIHHCVGCSEYLDGEDGLYCSDACKELVHRRLLMRAKSTANYPKYTRTTADAFQELADMAGKVDHYHREMRR